MSLLCGVLLIHWMLYQKLERQRLRTCSFMMLWWHRYWSASALRRSDGQVTPADYALPLRWHFMVLTVLKGLIRTDSYNNSASMHTIHFAAQTAWPDISQCDVFRPHPQRLESNLGKRVKLENG